MTDNLRVSQGLVVPEERSQKGSAQVREPQPFESITSYRLDYVRHAVQPRMGRQKAAFQPDTGPAEPAASWNARQELVDEAGEVVQNFKTWSLEAKIHDQVQTKESGLPTEPRFLSKDRTRTHSKAWNPLPRHAQKEEPDEPKNHLASVDFPNAVKPQGPESPRSWTTCGPPDHIGLTSCSSGH